jgi:carbamoyl-phosphate synthase small subunit
MYKEYESVAATLLLADGTIYQGRSLGHIGTATGEICFNTGMTGYQEVFTDPSYYGQTLIMTSNHIGNYGVLDADTESSSVKISSLITKRFSGNMYSRTTAPESLQQYLDRQHIVGITDIDTRALTVHVRRAGAMNCVISSTTADLAQLQLHLAAAPDMSGLDLAQKVSTRESYYLGDASSSLRVAVLDCGIKQSILQCLVARGIYVRVYPCHTTLVEMEQWQPHGYFISNGPGDPAAMPYAVETVRAILATGKPLFGICLGHQLLALAAGAQTTKMHHGHRGLNHPVKNLITGVSEITSQNHGFEIDSASAAAQPDIEITHINLNDQSIEGIRIKGRPAFSVQYHPESSPGPHDSRYLFDTFTQYMQV